MANTAGPRRRRDACCSLAHVALVSLALAKQPLGLLLVALLLLEGLLPGREQAASTGRGVSTGEHAAERRVGAGGSAQRTSAAGWSRWRGQPRGAAPSPAPRRSRTPARLNRGSIEAGAGERRSFPWPYQGPNAKRATPSQRSVSFRPRHSRIARGSRAALLSTKLLRLCRRGSRLAG